MGYVYAALWFIVGMILVFKMGKENKAFFAVGGFFFFWGVWQTLNEVLAIVALQMKSKKFANKMQKMI